MDKLLLLNPFELRRADLKTVSGYGFAAVGSEFCQNQLPKLEDLKKFHRKTGIRPAIATSIMTDAGLELWAGFFRKLAKTGLSEEVIINDFGILPFVKGRFKLCIGRIMARDFSKMGLSWALKFFSENGVTGIEADTPELLREIKRFGLAVSWHRGYSLTAPTTFCPFEKHFRAVCSKTCLGEKPVLKNADIGYPLTLLEKAYFKSEKRGTPAGISRIIDTLSLELK